MRHFVLILISLTLIFPVYGKVHAESDPVQDVQNYIAEKSPSFISIPFSQFTRSVEKLRRNLGDSLEEKRAKADLKVINTKEGTTPEAESGKVSKSAKFSKYVELFFLTMATFIINNKVIFYIFSLLIIFFIVRFLFRLIF